MERAEFQAVLAVLAQTPANLAHIVEGIPEVLVHEKLSADEFSVTEHVCHLRDIESDGYEERFKRILNEDHPQLPDIDGGRLAFERNYNQQDIHHALNEFSKARTRNLVLLQNQKQDQLAREGDLQGVGRVKLSDLIVMLCEHDAAHLDKLQALQNRLCRQSQ
jgi:hypothetical protein